MTGNQQTSAAVYAKVHSSPPFLQARNAAIDIANALVLCIQQFRRTLAGFIAEAQTGSTEHRSVFVTMDG